MMLKKELNEIGGLIKKILLTDSYVENVNPEYLRKALVAYPSREGKYLRPALLMWCCGLFGGRIEKSVKIAAAVELYHTWTLVHDDIIDNDDFRRKALSVHASLREQCLQDHSEITKDFGSKFGTDLAILCGDIQQAWANHLILQAEDDGISSEIIISILRRLNGHVNPDLISGEAVDVYFTLLPITDVTPEEMTRMLLLKTGKLIRFAAECGALVGLSKPDFATDRVKLVGDFAEKAALAFQLKDDLLGLFANETELGKPVGSDLREGKRTLLFAMTANRLTGADLEYFLEKLGHKNVSTTEIKKVNSMIAECGAQDEIEKLITTLIHEAQEILISFPDNRYRSLLTDWVNFIAKRNF